MKANRLVIRNLLLCGITSLALSSWSGVSTSVENADRPEADIARDAGRKPGQVCLLYTSPSPRDGLLSRMPSSA